MRSPRPRIVGIVLVIFGLFLALLLALFQSASETMLGEFTIAAVVLLAVLAVTFGLFMIIRNRGVRTDTGVR
ncbi:MAG TPA: hypothetical protein VF342_00310 [Alphaproteobacteria bacterium]